MRRFVLDTLASFYLWVLLAALFLSQLLGREPWRSWIEGLDDLHQALR